MTQEAGRKTSWGGRLLQDGAPGGPVLRLVVRWVRRPLLPAVRLWRRNIQLRVVAATLLMSLGVVAAARIRGHRVGAQRPARNQGEGGREPVRGRFRGGEGQGRHARLGRRRLHRGGRGSGSSVSWRNDLVTQLASSGQGAFYVVALGSASSDSDSASSNRGPRGLRLCGPPCERSAEPAGQRRPGDRRVQDVHLDQVHRRPGRRARSCGGHPSQGRRRAVLPALLPLPAGAGGEVAHPGQDDAGDRRALRRGAARGDRLARGAAGGDAGADGGRSRRTALDRRAQRAHEGHRRGRHRPAGRGLQQDGAEPPGARSTSWRSCPGCSGGSSPTSRTSCAPR